MYHVWLVSLLIVTVASVILELISDDKAATLVARFGIGSVVISSALYMLSGGSF